MNVDEVLEAVEQMLQPKQLGSIERFVLRQSWLGQTYSEMAKQSGYGSDYIKEIGSQLWQDLSSAIGEKVTKKNLHIFWNNYQQSKISLDENNSQQEFKQDSKTEWLFCNSPITAINFPGSPVPLDSPLYINRPPIEELVCTEIKQPGCLIRIKAPKKMGKSSLLNRIISHARLQAYHVVNLDFQEAEEAVFTSLDKFLRWFCANVSRQLNLVMKLDDYWDTEMGSKVSCKIYFEAWLLNQIERPIVLVLNEVNRVFEHPNIAQDFLPMLRFWHEIAKQNQIWQKLRLVVVHTTEIYIPLKLNQSPFNVGLAVLVPRFTQKQVQDLAQRYGLDWTVGEEGAQRLAPLYAMVGGHPYLVNLAFYHLHRGEITLEQLLQTAPTPSGIYTQHLREHLTLLQGESKLVSDLQQIVTAGTSVILDAIAAYKLESMGLIHLDGDQASFSCELYRLYFRQQLAKENTAQELSAYS
ncbi:MAG: AAA-like domain-containing protein [Gloeotrichia echinulata GP01]